MAFSPRRPRSSASSSSHSGRPRNDRNERNSGRPVSTSLSSRFSSMAAQRIASTSRPLRVGVSKPSSGGRHRNRNDRGMEIDQVGSSSTPRSAGRNNRNNRQGKNNNNSNNNNNNKNRGGNRKPQRKNDKPKASLNQTDLDKDLDSYMMKNESTARNNLDMELDSYMSAAPSKH